MSEEDGLHDVPGAVRVARVDNFRFALPAKIPPMHVPSRERM